MIRGYLRKTRQITREIDQTQVATVIAQLAGIRSRGGRLFLIGNGGGAGHASHAAADFRKIARIESYAWGENVSDLTAWVNDENWESAVANWLEGSRFTPNDGLLVFSVGGASDSVSTNLKWAMSYAYGATILGIVGAAGGEVARYATACVVIPSFSTPHVEGLQAVLWHLIVSELA